MMEEDIQELVAANTGGLAPDKEFGTSATCHAALHELVQWRLGYK